MSEINFQPIFDYIDTALKEQSFQLGSRIDAVQTQVANLATQVQTLTQEVRVSNYRLDRLEDWAPKVGDKTSIPFEF